MTDRTDKKIIQKEVSDLDLWGKNTKTAKFRDAVAFFSLIYSNCNEEIAARNTGRSLPRIRQFIWCLREQGILDFKNGSSLWQIGHWLEHESYTVEQRAAALILYVGVGSGHFEIEWEKNHEIDENEPLFSNRETKPPRQKWFCASSKADVIGANPEFVYFSDGAEMPWKHFKKIGSVKTDANPEKKTILHSNWDEWIKNRLQRTPTTPV